MGMIIILVVTLIIGAIFIKNAGCGCGSLEKEKDSKGIDKRDNCCDQMC